MYNRVTGFLSPLFSIMFIITIFGLVSFTVLEICIIVDIMTPGNPVGYWMNVWRELSWAGQIGPLEKK